jgi:hypothetical protein
MSTTSGLQSSINSSAVEHRLATGRTDFVALVFEKKSQVIDDVRVILDNQDASVDIGHEGSSSG